MSAAPRTILLDNGSLEPAATIALRGLAARLAGRIGQEVEPVSLLHSSAVDPALINGQAAEILLPALERRLAAGQSEFTVVPLFFGPSRALTEYLPENLARLREKHPALQVRMAAPLFANDDDRLAQILAGQVVALASPARRVALVDHGSPVRAVTEVRNTLARQLNRLLGPAYTVAPCSMERRAGQDYDFGEPLLAGLLRSPGWNSSDVTVAMQFLLPGRHASSEGDVAAICRAAEVIQPDLHTQMTALVGTHPLLVEILSDRWRSVLS